MAVVPGPVNIRLIAEIYVPIALFRIYSESGCILNVDENQLWTYQCLGTAFSMGLNDENSFKQVVITI